jgi:lipopolysaccharide biosynthesis protein
MDSQIIAFYLPQFHPTPHNDLWWGKGFTEWTNVGKAKPLYPGHYQPKVPADLGYYDLRLPEVRQEQAKLAQKAGVTGFCYYHYWFENGFEELDKPFKEVVNSGEPKFPFCLCWANESWYSKFWNKDGTSSKKILAEQKYLGSEDHIKHFYSLLKAFKDLNSATL